MGDAWWDAVGQQVAHKYRESKPLYPQDPILKDGWSAFYSKHMALPCDAEQFPECYSVATAKTAWMTSERCCR